MGLIPGQRTRIPHDTAKKNDNNKINSHVLKNYLKKQIRLPTEGEQNKYIAQGTSVCQ